MRINLFALSAVTAGCLAFALACTEGDGSSVDEESPGGKRVAPRRRHRHLRIQAL